ncbi:hypothetical protein EJB05_33787 [Eragrostis curvula]|uniref:RING-type E3 ubiquitin transferase n=1 Tax=Eragrostis curvula TaxID=38414 RepID=A0A5J9U290_9POAL|nr:hypothetical protein EJB05_33787 [Eragrostis curvula]
MEMVTVEDTDPFDCVVCCHPLKPPIFECENGHPLCSSCRDKLAPVGKCHMCRVFTHGYRRSRAMEHLVEALYVRCPNAAHGCNVKPLYYDLASHRQACPHAPCHYPGETCSFVGTTKQLVERITGSHGWSCTTRTVKKAIKARARQAAQIRLVLGSIRACFVWNPPFLAELRSAEF